MRLTLTKSSPQKLDASIYDADGGLVNAFAFDPRSKKQLDKLAVEVNLDAGELYLVAMRVLKTPKDRDGPAPTETIDCPEFAPGTVPAEPVGPFTVVVRGIKEPRESGREFTAEEPLDALRAAFAVADYPAPEPLVTWADSRLACLDLDYHRVTPPSPEILTARALDVRPKPSVWHRTHGGGAKLFYTPRDGYTAAELASVAAVSWLGKEPTATAELVRHSRHPMYTRERNGTVEVCGPVWWADGDGDLSALGTMLGREYDPAQVEDYLVSQGWETNGRYPHTGCPIDPCPSDGNDPVIVREDGIYCHRCAGKGLRYRSKTAPGWVSWGAMFGTVTGRFASMVQNRTHWEHARHVLRREYPQLPEKLLNGAYSAAIRSVHGEQANIGSVYSLGWNLLRINGQWVSKDLVEYVNPGDLLAALPAAQVNYHRDASRVCELKQNGDLSEYGYPALYPIAGIPVYGTHLSYGDDRVPYFHPAKQFRGPLAAAYRRPAERIPLDRAWEIVERVFPGILREYVELLIVMKGFAEGQAAQSTFALATGPSGSAKSSTVHVAASLCGDFATELTWTRDTERLRAGVRGALNNGTFCVVNETFKDAARERISPRAAADPLLNLTPHSTSHKLYTGHVPLGRLPVMVLTDVDLPRGVSTDMQLARRLVWVQCPRRLDWETSLKKYGCKEPWMFRLLGHEEAAAGDTIVSGLIDRFFSHTRTLEDCIEELGFKLLSKAEDMGVRFERLRDFFKLVAELPDLEGVDAKRLPGPGWKKIARDAQGEIGEVWGELADGSIGPDWTTSRACKEQDWNAVLGLSGEHIYCEISPWKESAVYVRFRRGSSRRPTWVNGKSL